MAMTEVKLILSILERHNRFTKVKRKRKCVVTYGNTYFCSRDAKWSFVPLAHKEPWDRAGTRGYYCNAHMISHIVQRDREYIAIQKWLDKQEDYVRGMRELRRVSFVKNYPRRIVRRVWQDMLGKGGEPIEFIAKWEIRHVSGPNSKPVPVAYADTLDEAQRIARHFIRYYDKKSVDQATTT